MVRTCSSFNKSSWVIAVTIAWCVQLSGKSNQGALTQSNSNLRRLDLMSELVGTFLFGTCLSNFGAARALAALAVFSGAMLPYALICIDKACPSFSHASASYAVACGWHELSVHRSRNFR